MTASHIPDLAQIEKLPNLEIRFYAIVGAVVSLAAALELKFLDVFIKGMNIDREQSVHIFYKAKSASHRRDISDTAMRQRLGSGPLVPDWTAIMDRIIKLTGRGGTRHLIAHNFVRSVKRPKTFQANAYNTRIFSVGHTEFMVTQDQEQVLALSRTPQKADFDGLLKTCRDLISVLSDIDKFLARVP